MPLSTVYSKSFLSFTQSLEVANVFLNIGKNALLTVENDPNIYNLFSQADIEEFSYSPGEKEVLFFPFLFLELKNLPKIQIIKFINLS